MRMDDSRSRRVSVGLGTWAAVVFAAGPAAAADDPPFTDAERKTIARYERRVQDDEDAARFTKGGWIVEAPPGAPARFVAALAVYLERVDAFVVERLGVEKRYRTQPTLVVFPSQEEFLERVEIVGRTAFFRAWVDRAPVGVAAGGKSRGKGRAAAAGGEYHVYTGLLDEDAVPSFDGLDLEAVRREVVRSVLYAAATGNLVEAFWFDRGASQVLGRIDPFGPPDAPGTAPPLVGEPRPPLARTLSLRPEAWVADNQTMLLHDPIAETAFVFLESEAGERWWKKVRDELQRLRSGRGALLDERDVARMEEDWYAWLDARESE